MADMHGDGVHSRMMVAVAVKPATVSATSPYGDDQTKEREVRDAMVVAGHGRAQSSAAFSGHGDDGNVKCGFTSARMVALVGLGVEEMVVELWVRWIGQWHCVHG